MAKNKEKFSFSIDFQLEILRYIIKDQEGFVMVDKIKSSYLTLIEHSIIAEALIKFWKKNKRIPSQTILKESIRELLNHKNYVDLVTTNDIPNINSVVDNLYSKPLEDRDIIQDKILKFSAFVQMKNLSETFDLENFEQYSVYHKKVAEIIQESEPKKEDTPIYLVRGVVNRQFKRQADPLVLPTPFKQLNDLTNGGGYDKGSIIVLLDKAKAKKTFTMVNVARGYLRMMKNVLYIDTENGKYSIMNRMVQSTLNKTKLEMQSGDYDKLEQKHVRKYKRLGVELAVEKVLAMVDDANTIKEKILEFEKFTGKKVNVLMIDYAGKLASISKKTDDFDRIGDVYVDLENLASEIGIEHVWTAHHITREGSKHKHTRYEENDIAGAVNIIRNAQAVIGLNSTEEEEDNNIQRMEIVVQRDGKPYGRAVFSLNVETQRMNELTKQQREVYDEEYGKSLDSDLRKKMKRNVSDADNKKKASKDI